MSVENRINILSNFRKMALNFKSFERYWGIALGKAKLTPKELDRYNSIDIQSAFQEYQRGQLPEKLQAIMDKHSEETSLHISPNVRLPKGERTSRERAGAEIMMSGRHSPDAYIPTKQVGLDVQGNPIQSLEGIETAKESGDLPIGESVGWKESKTKWAPYLLVYKGSEGVISKQYRDPNEARWVSSHPEVASRYAKKGKEGLLEIYDLRKIPEDKRSFYTKNITKDIRGIDHEDILRITPNAYSPFAKSPFYEMTVADEDLHKARIAKYKALPGLGWMLVEGRNILRDGLTEEEAKQHFDLLKGDAEKLSKENPALYFYYNFHKFSDLDLNEKALNNLIDKDPFYYFENNYDKLAKNLGLNYLNKKGLESIAKDSFGDYFLDNYASRAQSLGLGDLNIEILNQAAEINPFHYFYYNLEKYAESIGFNPEQTREITKRALDNLSKNNPRSYFEQKLHERDGTDDFTIQALENFAKKDSGNYFYYGLTDLAKSLGRNDINGLALKDLADDPGYYFEEGLDQKALELGFGDINIIAAEKARSMNLAIPNLDKYSGAKDKLIKLALALDSIGMVKESSRVRHLLNIR